MYNEDINPEVEFMKRTFLLLLCSVLLLGCLAACRQPDVQTPEQTTLPDDQPDAGMLDLVKDAASDYVIVRPADLSPDHPAFAAAVLFRDAVQHLTGVALPIVTDNVDRYPESAHEILIGQARGKAPEGCAVAVLDGKLCIGGEVQLLSETVAAFFKSCFNYDVYAQEDKAMNSLSIPEDLTMDQSGTLTPSTPVKDTTAWGDSITYAADVQNLINFRYLDQGRKVAEITNGNVKMVYDLAKSKSIQVAGLYNKDGVPYLTDSMDTFVVTSDGTTLYSSQSGNSARANIYRFGYYYYDIHLLDQSYLPSDYAIDSSVGSYDLLSKAKRPSSHMISSIDRVDGVLTTVVEDPFDPYFSWNVNYAADKYNAISITMRTEHASSVTLYLLAGSVQGLGTQHVSFQVTPGSEYQTYIVPLDGVPNYTGNVTIMRVDCGEQAGEVVEIKEMKAVKISTQTGAAIKLDRNLHVYGDKLHQQIRIVAQSKTGDISAMGTVTRIEQSRVASLIIADKNGKHSSLDGVDFNSVEYLGFDLTDAGVFGYIFPAGTEYTGKVGVVLQDGYYVITQSRSVPTLAQYESCSLGHRIYTSTAHSFDELEQQAYVERHPLTEVRLVTNTASVAYAGYDPLVGCYSYTLHGANHFNTPFYKQPQKHYIVDTEIKGDGYDREIYVFARTHSGFLECGAVLDEADRLLPINVEVCKNFRGEYEEPLYDPNDTDYGYCIFPVAVGRNQTRHFKSVALYQNWGSFPLKQLSSIQFIAPYYHLSCGVTETNCIAPYYVYGKDYWTLPDFRAMSSPLWSGQPQHTSAGRLYWLQYTDADGNFYGSESQSADISSSGPVYVDVDMSYLSDDGKVWVDYRHVEHAQTDENRTYYTLELTVLEDLEIKDFVNNFSFFSMDGRGIVYKKLGYLDENDQPKTVDLVLKPHTNYYKLSKNGGYFDYFIDADSGHTSIDSVNMAVVIKDCEMVLGGKPYEGNLVLKEQFDGEVNLATLTVDAGDVQLRTGDKVRIDMILLPWGSPESKNDANVQGVRLDTVLSPIKTEAKVGTVIEDVYVPTVMAQDNVAEFTVSGGGSTVYAVRVYGFESYTKPAVQILQNGSWVDYDFQYHDYDGYFVFREDDGSYSYAFSFEMTDGQPITFRVTQ